MTYPPGNPGYQPAQPAGAYGSPSPSFAKPADAESKLPVYLQIAVVVLGFGVYLGNFGPILSVADSEYPVILGNAGYTVPLALFAALLAGAGLLPKAKVYTPIVAVSAAVGALVAINTSLGAGDNYTIGWGLWLVLTFSILQAAAAVIALLLESGVITAPAPRPKYDPYSQYGLPPGNSYYGQPGQPGQPGAPQGYGTQGTQGQPGAQQQSGYPSYGGFSSAPPSGGFGAPSTPQSGGFGTAPSSPPPAAPSSTPSGAPSSTPSASPSATPSAAPSSPQGPPTPPTGFPSFGPPPGSGSNASAPTVQTPSSQQSQGGSASAGPTQS